MTPSLPSRLLRLFAGGLLLLALAALFAFAYLRTSLPLTQGSLSLGKAAGLGNPVDILRDSHGVPHIYARTESDALFALGYVHAQDRLWQMEVNRRIGRGTLAEIFGKDAVETDRFLRTVGLRQAAQSAYDHFDAETRASLDSYARGVNAFLRRRTGALPPEFLILRVKPEAWTGADCILWTKVMALDMGYMWRRELTRLKLLKHLSPAQINELMPPYPGDRYPPVNNLATLYRELPVTLLPHGVLREQGGVPGSNNWVVSGARSQTGKPLLANDPHITMSAPGVWYLAHIQVGSHNRVGVTFPGMPIVVLGRTDHVAWGFTNTEPDVHDLVIEKVQNRFWGEYLTPGGTDRFTARHDIIKVRGGADVRIMVRESRNGPIISDAFPALKEALQPNHVLALRWTALRQTDNTLRAGLHLARATSVTSTIDLLRDFEGPQNNVVIADVQGNIGFVAAGTVPRRHPDHPTAGLWPAPGWQAESDWAGFVPYERLPRSLNPAQGWIGTANHRITPPPGEAPLTTDWEDPYRYERIAALITARAKHDIASFAAMQADELEPALHRTVQVLSRMRGFAAQRQALAGRMAGWDGFMRRERAEPLIAAAWVRAFERRVIADHLGEDFQEFERRRPRFILNLLQDETLASKWCDDITTPHARESCSTMADLALQDAMADISSRLGADSSRWRWDALHVVVHEHRPFSFVPQLRRHFELRTPMGGGGDSLHNAHPDYDRANPYEATLSQSYRGIFDLSNLDNSRYAIPTGQSGNPFSPHFQDMEPLWRTMRYITIATRRTQVEAAGASFLQLQP